MMTIGRNARLSTGIASSAAVDSAKPSTSAGGCDRRAIRPAEQPADVPGWPHALRGGVEIGERLSRLKHACRVERLDDDPVQGPDRGGRLDKQPADAGHDAKQRRDRGDGDRYQRSLLDRAAEVAAQRLDARLGRTIKQ